MNMVNVSEQILVEVGEKIRRFIGNQVDVQVGYELQIQVATQVFNPLFVLIESNLISVKQNSKII
jgi:hypothetical protein